MQPRSRRPVIAPARAGVSGLAAKLVAAGLLAACGSDGPKPAADEYDDGVYHCCAPGQGDSCCAGHAQGECFAYGGIYGDCTSEGAELDARVICGLCCEGLTEVEPMSLTNQPFPGYPPGCGPSGGIPSIHLCVRCGDGVCAAWENRCICPQDCP